MGKPYSKELDKISETYQWANKTPIDNLIEFVKRSKKTPLYVIGSGGSFSATTFASLLHQDTGMVAKCLTPLEFLEYDNIDSNCSVLIITANGNNKDILSAFDKAIEIKPKNIGIVCASATNKLTKKAAGIPNVLVHGVKIPIGKDGFLATNSLIATLIWLCRSYILAHSLLYKIPSLSELVYLGKSKEEFEKDLKTKLGDFTDRDTVVCLYDNWGKTAAVDAESKLIESGLVNIQLADYRNFAHGRHNWLDKNKEKTCLIALVNPNCEQLANKTMELIPDHTPKMTISTNYEGPVAAISLLIQIFYIVKFFGEVRNIDPGRPGVADFGRKMYQLSIPKNNLDSFTGLEKNTKRKKLSHGDTNNLVCIGSGLVALDVIYKQDDKQPNFLAGGSCGNVLTILSYMGWDSYPIIRLGQDVEGKRIIEDMKKWKVKTKFIEKESGIQSPRIIERITGGEKPVHRFYTKCEHGKWLPSRKTFLLKSLELIQGKIPKSNVFYFDRATPSAYEIASYLKKQNCIIVFEPPKFLLDDKMFLKCLKISDIVKYCNNQANNIRELDISIPLEIRTDGEKGLQYKAKFLRQQSWKKLSGISTDNLVDAAGSGDWLTAGLVHVLCGHKSLKHVTKEKLEDALNFGQILASINCGFAGARGMMYYLTRDELLELIVKKSKNKEKDMGLTIRETSKPKLTSKLASECKICLCST